MFRHKNFDLHQVNPTTSDAEKDRAFDAMFQDYDPLYKAVAQKLADPKRTSTYLDFEAKLFQFLKDFSIFCAHALFSSFFHFNFKSLGMT